MSDDISGRPGRSKPAVVSIEQLLEAEHAAERFLADARQKAAERVEDAYKEAQATDHRTSQRIERLNKGSRITNDRLVGDIEAHARTFDTRSTDFDHMREALRIAVAKLAARLTDGAP